MKSKLNHYLDVMMKEAKRYGVDPLFVRTNIGRIPGSIDVIYHSEALGKRRSKRSLTFEFYVVPDNKADIKEFVPLKEIMAIEDPEIYEVHFHFDRGMIQLDIEKGGVEDFNVSSRRDPFYLECLDEFEKNYGDFKPEQLLKVLVSMHALGTDDFVEAVDSGKIVLPKKK